MAPSALKVASAPTRPTPAPGLVCALWRDEAVVCEDGIVTSRSPQDLDAFVSKIVEEVSEGTHHQLAA